MFKNVEENDKIYKKVMDQIVELILSGKLKKGDKLPPERQLAEELSVGRPTLKQALSALEALGIINSRHGGGNYITFDTSNVFNPLVLKFYLNEGKQFDILEFRYILEIQMARLAALKSSSEQIEALSVIIEKMKNVTCLDERLDLNSQFHLEIAKISGNALIFSIYDSIVDLVIKQTLLTDGVEFYESHRKIFEAIKNKDPEKASLYMSQHFKQKFPNYKYYDALNNMK